MIPPPPGAPVEIEAQVVERSGGRARLAVAALAIVAVGAGGLALLASRGDEGDAAGALGAAQEFVEQTDSFRVEVRQTERISMGDPDGAGSDTTMRTVTKIAVASVHRWQLTQDLGDQFGFGEGQESTTVRIGSSLFVQDGFGEITGEPEGPAWIEVPIPETGSPDGASLADAYEQLANQPGSSDPDDPFADSFKLGVVLGAYLAAADGDPASLTRVVSEATDPSIEEQLPEGGVRLRTRLPALPELASIADLPPVDLLLDLDADRRPVLAKFTAEAGTASSRVEVHFSGWGEAIRVDPPPEADIDRTPWIAEEAIDGLDPAMVLAPITLPDGLELVSADVYDSGGFGEFGDSQGDPCPSLELSYASADDPTYDDPTAMLDLSEEELDALFSDMSYFSVSVSDGCGDVPDMGPFDRELGGLPSRGSDGFWEVQVGTAIVAVNASIDEDAVEEVVASLRPTTAAQLQGEVAEWAQDASGSLGFFGFGGFGMFGGLGGFGSFGGMGALFGGL